MSAPAFAKHIISQTNGLHPPAIVWAGKGSTLAWLVVRGLSHPIDWFNYSLLPLDQSNFFPRFVIVSRQTLSYMIKHNFLTGVFIFLIPLTGLDHGEDDGPRRPVCSLAYKGERCLIVTVQNNYIH